MGGGKRLSHEEEVRLGIAKEESFSFVTPEIIEKAPKAKRIKLNIKSKIKKYKKGK